MDLTTLRALLAAGRHAEANEAVFQAYRRHRSARNVAPVFGCTQREWVRLLAEYPRLRDEREQARRELVREEVRALRHRWGIPEEAPPAPPTSLPTAMASRTRKPAAAGPPLIMTLALDIGQDAPPTPRGKTSRREP